MSTLSYIPTEKLVRTRITIEGIVQGVGFRPFIFTRAQSNSLKGYVLNNERGVEIEVEGEGAAIKKFLREIPELLPPQAQIVSLRAEDLPRGTCIRRCRRRRARHRRAAPATLRGGVRGPGAHALDWDEREGRGVRVARGVYVVRLTAGATSLTRKVVVLCP